MKARNAVKTYEIQVSNYFDAESVEDAILQMAAWLTDNAYTAGYRVIWQREESSFVDAESINVNNYWRNA